MAQIPDSVPLTGVVAPTDERDEYAVIDPLYGIDGLRSVADIASRDTIAAPRRREGMLVFTRSDKRYWQLEADLLSWKEFKQASSGQPATGLTWCIQPNQIDEALEIPPEATFLHANTMIGPTGSVLLAQGAELKSL